MGYEQQTIGGNEDYSVRMLRGGKKKKKPSHLNWTMEKGFLLGHRMPLQENRKKQVGTTKWQKLYVR